MTMLHQAQSKAEKPRLERSGINRLIQIFVSILLMGLVLFFSAGRLDWPAAWIFLGTYTLVILTVGVWVTRRHPDVVNERGKIAHNARSWDKILMTIYSVMLLWLVGDADCCADRGVCRFADGDGRHLLGHGSQSLPVDRCPYSG
jgi:hypothetical protein